MLSAGLPNITGIITTNDAAKINVNGAFALGASGPDNWPLDADGASNNVTFDASRSSAIFGSNDTVQPPALSLIPQIKY